MLIMLQIVKLQQQNTKNNKNKTSIKPLPEPEIEPGISCTAVWRVTSRPLSQLHCSQAIYLFHRTVSKHKQTKTHLRTTLFQQSFFLF